MGKSNTFANSKLSTTSRNHACGESRDDSSTQEFITSNSEIDDGYGGECMADIRDKEVLEPLMDATKIDVKQNLKRPRSKCIPYIFCLLAIAAASFAGDRLILRGNINDAASTSKVVINFTEHDQTLQSRKHNFFKKILKNESDSDSDQNQQLTGERETSNNTLGAEEKKIARVCALVEKSLDIHSWEPILYHKDRQIEYNSSNGLAKKFDKNFFDTVEEDDADARATVLEFNRIQKSNDPVLKKSLLEAGIKPGSGYRALQFIERLTTSRNRPLQIAVFGNSFTIGSNCGESTHHDSNDCAWPHRLSERWKDIFSSLVRLLPGVAVDWHMWQENAQGSIVIAQKLPAFIESFRSKNLTVDAILIDTSMTDTIPWFEAVVRAFLKTYPGVVIVSIVGGEVSLVHSSDRAEKMRRVQQKYQLTSVDIAKMVNILRNESSTAPDRLWPQGDKLVNASGLERNDPVLQGEYYWPNFVPRVRKKKVANYANSHPPWPTHQYVADTVAHALLQTANLGCSLMGKNLTKEPPLLPEKTVTPKLELDSCHICLEPLVRIDAKVPPNNASGIVYTVCGDWKWVTDERNRAGWQSDVVGSLIRFRFRIGATNPLIVMTYTGSYTTFGPFRVTFRTPNEEPLLKCFDISNNTKTLPSVELGSSLPRYTLPKVVAFPSKMDLRTKKEWELFNATVLSKMKGEVESNNNGDEVDMYIENIGAHAHTRVKIQTITAC